MVKEWCFGDEKGKEWEMENSLGCWENSLGLGKWFRDEKSGCGLGE